MFRIAAIALCVALAADQVNAEWDLYQEARERRLERRGNRRDRRRNRREDRRSDLAQLSSEQETTDLDTDSVWGVPETTPSPAAPEPSASAGSDVELWTCLEIFDDFADELYGYEDYCFVVYGS